MGRRDADPRHFREAFYSVAVDLVRTSTDNRRVIARRVPRPVIASLLMVTTVVAALLPPTHIHLVADDHDHHHAAAIEHSHWAAHGHAGSEVEQGDEDGRVLFVDHPARVQAARATAARPAVAAIGLLILPGPPAFTGNGQLDSGNAPRDGPSRDFSRLRAPPVSPAR
jgi:hypothetical protein